jgi:hypothetical protein
MDHEIRTATLNVIRELNGQQKSDSASREANRLAQLKIEAEQRKRFKQDVQGWIASMS